ncbi:MAG: phage terminase large subunit [Magnetococcus sp. DMHC-6]
MVNKGLAFAKRSLTAYGIAQWEGYRPARHHRQIASCLESVTFGNMDRLMIFMPPRHGKSMLASEFFPAWYLGHHPSRQVMFVTYSQDAANSVGRKVRNQLLETLHPAAFPECRLAADSSSVRRFDTTSRGAFYAVGIGGPITGRGADLLIIDDPVKNRVDADSVVIRKRLREWYTSTAYSRLMPKGAVVLIQTRWHEDDLAGWLLREHGGEGWHILELPALARFDDALGRCEGEALWPEAFHRERLLKIRDAVGSRDWSALYQQRPVPEVGGMIKAAWLGRYEQKAQSYERIVQSWDTAYKAKVMHDPSVCTTWGEIKGIFHLLHVWVGRVEYPDLKRMVGELASRWHVDAILVEDRGSGQSLLQELRRETRWSLIGIVPVVDKVTRMSVVSALFESGRVLLPQQGEWLAEYEAEVLSFPTSVHDDQVDSTSQFLSWAKNRAAGSTVVRIGRREVRGMGGYPT